MVVEYEILTRAEIERRGERYLWPGDGQMALMPAECWELVRTNPEHQPALPVAACAKIDGQRVVSLALIHHSIHWKGRDLPCLWDYSFYAEPLARRQGTAGLLMRRLVNALTTQGILLASHGATPDANRLYQALRMRHVGQAPRHIGLLRVEPILRRYLRWLAPQLASLAAAPINALLRGRLKRRALSFEPAARDFKLSELEEFTEDTLPHTLTHDPRPRLKRTAALLNWRARYARMIGKSQIRLFVIRNADAEAIAYFIARIATHATLGSQRFPNVRLFRLLDLYTPNDEAVTAATLYHLVQTAIDSRCEIIELITTDPVVRHRCDELKLLPMNGYDMFVSRGDTNLAEIPIDNWFLTMPESEAAYY